MVRRTSGIAPGAAPAEHEDADDDHHDPEQGEELLAIERLGHRRSGEGAEHAGRREHGRAAPLHVTEPASA